MKNKILIFLIILFLVFINQARAAKTIVFKPLEPNQQFTITNCNFAGNGWYLTNLNMSSFVVTNVILHGNMVETNYNDLIVNGPFFTIYVKTNYMTEEQALSLFLQSSYTNIINSYTNQVNQEFQNINIMIAGLNTNLWNTITNKLSNTYSNNIIALENRTNIWNDVTNKVDQSITNGYATISYVDNVGSNYLNLSYANNIINISNRLVLIENQTNIWNTVTNKVDNTITNGYATINYVNNLGSNYLNNSYSNNIKNLENRTNIWNDVTNKVDRTITNGFASTNWVKGQGYLSNESDPIWEIEKGDYATTEWASQTFLPFSATNNLASTNWVNSQGFVKYSSFSQSTSNNVYIDGNTINITFKTNYGSGGGTLTNEVDPYFSAVSNRIPYLETNGNLNMNGKCITNACFQGNGYNLTNIQPLNIPYTNILVSQIANVQNALDFLLSNSISMNGSLLQAKFTASSTSGSAPLVVTFTDNSLMNITNRLWDINGDGSYELANPNYPIFTNTYTSNGIYNVKLLVQSYGGYSSLTNITISVGTILDNYKYWGVINTPTNPSDVQINNLSNEIATNRLMTKTITQGQTGYIYFVWPDNYGLGSVWSQPYNVELTAWTNWTQNLVQTNGLTNLVRIWRSDIGGLIINDSIFEIK